MRSPATVTACDGLPASPALARALDVVSRIPRPTGSEAREAMARRVEAGILPHHDAWGRPIVDDPNAERRRIERELQAATWETQAGQVEAARAGLRRPRNRREVHLRADAEPVLRARLLRFLATFSVGIAMRGYHAFAGMPDMRLDDLTTAALRKLAAYQIGEFWRLRKAPTHA